MGVYRRQYLDGRLSKDWYISYDIGGKQYKRKIGPNKKLAEQVFHDVELKRLKKESLEIYEERKIKFADLAQESI